MELSDLKNLETEINRLKLVLEQHRRDLNICLQSSDSDLKMRAVMLPDWIREGESRLHNLEEIRAAALSERWQRNKFPY